MRLYEMTADPGIRDMFSFMIARDTMHQNQWLAAVEELEKDGLETTPCPSNFPRDREMQNVAYQFYNCSEGTESQSGRWAQSRSPDGRGQFEYVTQPKPMGGIPFPAAVDPAFYGTPLTPTSNEAARK